MDISIRIHGGDEAHRRVERLRLFLSDLRPFFPTLVPIFVGWMRDQFESEGGWGGQAWVPLSPTYALWKQRHFPGRTILIRDGVMRRAASQPRREVTPRTLTLWIDDPKAPLHQEGGRRLPARPLIPDRLPVTALRDIDDAAEGYVRVLIGRLGL